MGQNAWAIHAIIYLVEAAIKAGLVDVVVSTLADNLSITPSSKWMPLWEQGATLLRLQL